MPRSLFLLFLMFLVGFDQPKLVKIKVADGITVSIPEGWKPMDGLDFIERYPSVRAPLAAFTDNDRLVDFSVNISATHWPDANLTLAQQFFKASISSMFDRVEMISEGVHEVHGKKFVYFEFESRVNGNKGNEELSDPILKYSYLQYYIEPKRTLVFSFNCPRRLREEWKASAQMMMKSVRIR
jgi:hypothetical protein